MKRPPWLNLVAMAEEEISAILHGLPPQLQEPARALPVTFERKPGHAWIEDGIEPDTLGLFVGPAFDEEISASLPLPAQIILFLHNLWELSEDDEPTFRRELRRTYLHELGHYLGLDETDLADRDLD